MKKTIAVSVCFVIALTGVFFAFADDHHSHRRNHERHQEREHNGHYDDDDAVPIVNNQVYEDVCGGCHFAYQPGLLPAASWQKIIEGSDQHFGEDLVLDVDTINEIRDYLSRNAADRSNSELSREILHGLGSTVPERITDIPEIKKEHRKISSDVFSRPSVGSFSNCPACHRGAERGIYDDDDVSIPN